jgi:hypothetical protein
MFQDKLGVAMLVCDTWSSVPFSQDTSTRPKIKPVYILISCLIITHSKISVTPAPIFFKWSLHLTQFDYNYVWIFVSVY